MVWVPSWRGYGLRGVMFSRTDLFSYPIYRIRIDPNSYDKEKIISDILHNKSLSNTRNAASTDLCNIHQSYLDTNNENFRVINYEKLIAVYHKIFEEFFNKEVSTTNPFEWEFSIINYTAITEGQSLVPHNHLAWDFSTAHYLNFKKDHVYTRFANPASSAQYLLLLQSNLYDIADPNTVENSYLFGNNSPLAEEDEMVIFPSSLNHEIVLQGPTKEPRITISTNIRIKKSK